MEELKNEPITQYCKCLNSKHREVKLSCNRSICKDSLTRYALSCFMKVPFSYKYEVPCFECQKIVELKHGVEEMLKCEVKEIQLDCKCIWTKGEKLTKNERGEFKCKNGHVASRVDICLTRDETVFEFTSSILLEYLKERTDPELEKFYMEVLEDKDMTIIIKMLRSIKFNVKLRLQKKKIEAETLKELFEACKTIISLNINCTKLKGNGDEVISEILRNYAGLRKLDLQEVDIENKKLPAIMKALQVNKTLENLTIGICEGDNLKDLSEAVKVNDSIKKFSLLGNGMTSIKDLNDALKTNTRLQYLKLAHVIIKDNEAKAISEMLKVNKRLVQLDLYCCKLKNIEVHLISQSLRDGGNNTLKTLNLEHNGITDSGAESIGDMLGSNKSLITLDLGANQITDIGFRYISIGLECNETLKELHLYSNKIKIAREIGNTINETLRANKTLIELNLALNNIEDEGIESLVEGLKSNITLKRLDLCSNKIGIEGEKLLDGLRYTMNSDMNINYG